LPAFPVKADEFLARPDRHDALTALGWAGRFEGVACPVQVSDDGTPIDEAVLERVHIRPARRMQKTAVSNRSRVARFRPLPQSNFHETPIDQNNSVSGLPSASRL
jgi:hypothetical protein